MSRRRRRAFDALSAVRFDAATSDRFELDTAADVQNLTKLTALCWYYATSVSAAGAWLSKSGGGGSGGWRFYSSSTTPTKMRLRWARGSNATPMDYLTSSSPLTLNKWQCVGVDVDQSRGAGLLASLFWGDERNPLALQGTTVTAEGSGTYDSDAANLLCVGNVYSANNTPCRGAIAAVALFNRVLSLEEKRLWQFEPQVLPGCLRMYAVGRDGLSLIDLTGGGHHSTLVSGCSLYPGLPLLGERRRPLPRLGIALTSVRTETVQTSETAVKQQGMARTRTETAQISEGKVPVRGVKRAQSEVQQIGESKLSRRGIVRALLDVLQLYDGGGSLILSQLGIRTETVNVAEAKNRKMGLTRTRLDLEQVTEATQTQRGLARLRTEVLQIVEAAVRLKGLYRRQADTVNVSEGKLRFLGLLRIRTESQQVGESKLTRTGRIRLQGEVVNLIEQIGTRLGLLRVKVDATQIAEAQAGLMGRTRVQVDPMRLTETTGNLRGITRLRTEVVQITETFLARMGGILGQLVLIAFLRPALRFRAWLNEEGNP
jgi:hypothetical protein